MKKYTWLLLAVISLLLIAAVSYFWATGIITSIEQYRSPLHINPPLAGPTVGKPLTGRVVIFLIDGLRLDTSLDAKTMPFLNQLRTEGASAAMHSRPPSFSEAGYTTILTSAWPDINDGPAINLDYGSIPTFTQDNIFSDAHRLGLHTAISGYYWFEELVPQKAVDASFYTPGEDAAADVDVMQAALPMLSGDYQLVLIHIDQVDYAGHHLGGPLKPAWQTAARNADDDLRTVVGRLDLQKDTIIVLSDHGHINRGGHGGPEAVTLVEPFVMAGAGVKPGAYTDIQMVDVAPTVAALLGLNLPGTAEGYIQASMLSVPTNPNPYFTADRAQKWNLYLAYTGRIDSKPVSSPDPSSAASYIDAMAQARSKRLLGERVARSFLALVLAALPLIILIRRKAKKALWMAGCALIFVFLFNLRYAIIDGRTYSLSSVDSQSWLISYFGLTAAISFGLTWLVYMISTRSFSRGSYQAVLDSLGYVFMTLYVLSLPILLSFAINGAVVTWTLPEFYTIFIALMSIIQWLFVAVMGLLLAGIAAAAARLVRQRIY